MKHSVQLLFTTFFCITANVAIAMKLEIPKRQVKNPKKITCIKDTLTAEYLTDDKIITATDREYKIVDTTTNTILTSKYNATGYRINIAVHPNKKTYALSEYYNQYDGRYNAKQRITIHNAQTNEIEHTIDWNEIDGNTINKMLFCGSDNSIAAGRAPNIILYNYITEKQSALCGQMIAFHPTKPFAYTQCQSLYLDNLETSKSTEVPKAPDYAIFCDHTPDESYLIIGSDQEVRVMKPDQKTHFRLGGKKKNFNFYGMAIHPKGKILMTVSKENSTTSDNMPTIDYWDLDAREWVGTRSLSIYKNSKISNISFSPSGAKFLILIGGELFEVEVPSELLQ